jgi:cellulose synthase/poly-beta-1,6-N-acetylglucosamine synthase-like glycosyltransferase
MFDNRTKLIRNCKNLGFSRACNQGAAKSSKRELIFLNNDTITTPNWATALIETSKNHRNIGCVGAKLLYKDDTIQHCGVVFDLLKKPHHIYKQLQKNHPATNKEREFKAVTGACMLMSKSLFSKIGMFETKYINGFEDIDLCLRLNKFGAKNIYTPKSQVYHLESQTDGRNKYTALNYKIFSSLWNNYIEEDETKYYKEDNIEISLKKINGNIQITYFYDKNIEEIANLAREKRNNKKECEELYIKALTINKFAKNTTEIYLELADFYRKNNKYEAAIEIYNMLCKVTNDKESLCKISKSYELFKKKITDNKEQIL